MSERCEHALDERNSNVLLRLDPSLSNNGLRRHAPSRAKSPSDATRQRRSSQRNPRDRGCRAARFGTERLETHLCHCRGRRRSAARSAWDRPRTLVADRVLSSHPAPTRLRSPAVIAIVARRGAQSADGCSATVCNLAPRTDWLNSRIATHHNLPAFDLAMPISAAARINRAIAGIVSASSRESFVLLPGRGLSTPTVLIMGCGGSCRNVSTSSRQ
jgi:hypothetical protein